MVVVHREQTLDSPSAAGVAGAAVAPLPAPQSAYHSGNSHRVVPAVTPAAGAEPAGPQAVEISDACRKLGIGQLKQEQVELINAAVQGNDVLGILPTGFGKSAVFQVAALVRGGICVVVTPATSLITDQCRALRSGAERGDLVGSITVVALIAGVDAEQVFSALALGDMLQAQDHGAVFIYTSPESMCTGRMLQFLHDAHARGVPLTMAVDEAHLIDRWSVGFRQSFAQLGAAAVRKCIPGLADVPIIALTATARQKTRMVITQSLGLSPNAAEVVRSPNRGPTLALVVILILATLALCHPNPLHGPQLWLCYWPHPGPLPWRL